MIRNRLLMAALAAALLVPALAARPAAAQGVMLTPLPGNPCPGGATLKNVWAINQLASDTMPFMGPAFAESLVVCSSTVKTGGAAIDVGIEYFDHLGLPSGAFIFCGLAPGNTISLATAPMPEPHGGILTTPFGAPGTYSARIFATKTNVVCDATVFDTGAIVTAFNAVPAWSKDVTITPAKSTQKGD